MDFDVVIFLQRSRERLNSDIAVGGTLGRSCHFLRAVAFTSLSSSPVRRRSQRFLFLEKVIASLALQDLDRIHEVGDLHQRNWTAIEACLVSDLHPAGFGKPAAFLVLGSFS